MLRLREAAEWHGAVFYQSRQAIAAALASGLS